MKAQRSDRDIALLLFNLGARRRQVVSDNTQPLYPGKDLVYCVRNVVAHGNAREGR